MACYRGLMGTATGPAKATDHPSRGVGGSADSSFTASPCVGIGFRKNNSRIVYVHNTFVRAYIYTHTHECMMTPTVVNFVPPVGICCSLY